MSATPPKSSEDQREAPIEIVAYDPSWSSRFEAERLLLEEALSPWLAGPIEHVGSTAVPRLSAKPIIDIMAPVHTLQASLPAIDAATDVGYLYHPYKGDVMHWFCKPSPQHRTHHLHLVPFESKLWLERLAFRDALRGSSKLAAEYSGLKARFARQYRHDREAYTEAKAPFVSRVLSAIEAHKTSAT